MTGMGRILILGSTGQVGTELKRSFADAGELICPDRTSIDLTNAEQVRAVVRRMEPDLILNAAAYTAVDRAESEADLAMAINAHAPRVLAEEAAQRGILLVHYSTDYVFDGAKSEPWVETDPTHPLNVYGASKLAGEEAIQAAGGKFLIFRTSWVYGPHGKNFLLTMLRLGRERDELNVVDDQIGAPTTSFEIARATRAVLDRILAEGAGSSAPASGVYHMTCSGHTSWFGFARAIFESTRDLRNGAMPRIHPIPSTAFPTPASRPKNSVLCCRKLRETFAVQLAAWESALQSTLQHLREDARA